MGLFSRLFSSPSPEQTPPQGASQAGVGFGQLPGFGPPLPGTYAVYRRMSAHPTLALAKSIVSAPILAGSWSFEVRRPDGKPTRRGPVGGNGAAADPLDVMLAERSAFVQGQLEALRTPLLVEALRALEFGWRPFEKVWELVGGRAVLGRLKPLLPDFTFVRVDAHGEFAGVEQFGAALGPEKCFVYTYDGEAQNHYGRSRHENAREAWSRWLAVDERAGQLATKAAAIIPMVHYPLGQSRDAAGVLRDNGDLADVILNGLGGGKGVKLPNMFASTDDPRLSADLAGKSAWVIGFLEASGAAANLGGMTDRQRYYDALMFRAWLRPERSGLESQHGTRADAQRHTDTGIIDSELIAADLCAQVNRGIVDDLLALNFGPESRGSVYVVPAPLQEAKRELLAKLLEAVWHSPQTLAEFLRQTDMDAVFDLMEVPKSDAQASLSGTT